MHFHSSEENKTSHPNKAHFALVAECQKESSWESRGLLVFKNDNIICDYEVSENEIVITIIRNAGAKAELVNETVLHIFDLKEIDKFI